MNESFNDGGPTNGRGVSRYVGIEIREVGDWANGEIVLEGIVDLTARLAGSAGVLGTGALLTMFDNIGGFCGGLASLPNGWVVTTNLKMRRTRLDATGTLRFRSTVLRKGSNATVTEVTVSDTNGVIAFGTLSSAVMVPAGGVPPWVRPVALLPPPGDESDGVTFEDWLGARDIADGGIELQVDDDFRNPWGIVHGGVTASLIDLAALRAVTSAKATIDAAVHYLAPAKVGPLRAKGTVLGQRGSDTVVRVEVEDAGVNRTTAIAIAAVRNPSRPT